MRAKCFGCGKYVKLGEGKAYEIKRHDGQTGQYICMPCADERAAEIGDSFERYCEAFGKPELV